MQFTLHVISSRAIKISHHSRSRTMSVPIDIDSALKRLQHVCAFYAALAQHHRHAPIFLHRNIRRAMKASKTSAAEQLRSEMPTSVASSLQQHTAKSALQASLTLANHQHKAPARRDWAASRRDRFRRLCDEHNRTRLEACNVEVELISRDHPGRSALQYYHR